MYECFHCGHRAVVWQSDFDYEDFGYEGKGIVHIVLAHIVEQKSSIEFL